jgi:hypothetical protein
VGKPKETKADKPGQVKRAQAQGAAAMAASNEQVQAFVSNEIRPWCEAARLLVTQAADLRARIDDVYQNLTADQPTTWEDERSDNPPHLLSPNDVLAINAFMETVKNLSGDGNYAPVVDACVRGL